MTDDLSQLLSNHPSPDRPLAGRTVLLVEDSRFASEAIRLLCLRSGARIRRADCLTAARRHLAVYRPSVVIVDMGLPDGSGAELIEELARATPRVPVILGTSGDTGAREEAGLAGADGFLAKPVESLALFQQSILMHLPPEEVARGVRPVPQGSVAPDPLALADDLNQMSEIMADERRMDYVTQFLGAVAKSAHDRTLEKAVDKVRQRRAAGEGHGRALAALNALLEDRIALARAV